MHTKNFQHLNLKMLKIILKFKLEMMKEKMKKEELYSNYSQSKFQRQQKISGLFAQVKKGKDYITRTTSFIE